MPGGFNIGFNRGFGPLGLDITNTQYLQLPINCVLAGDQLFERVGFDNEINDPNYRANVTVSVGGGGLLGEGSSFTVTSSNRGYD